MNESIVAAIVLVLVLVLPIIFGVRYLLSHYANNEQQDELFKDAKEMLYVYQNKKKTAGVIGILGGIIILIGEFMPYTSLWSFSITFYEGIKSESSLHALLADIEPIVLMIMYFSKRQYAGMGLGLLCMAYYAYLTIRDIDSFGRNILSEVVDIGYWIIWIGLVLAVVSPFCEKANRKLISIIKREEQ